MMLKLFLFLFLPSTNGQGVEPVFVGKMASAQICEVVAKDLQKTMSSDTDKGPPAGVFGCFTRPEAVKIGLPDQY